VTAVRALVDELAQVFTRASGMDEEVRLDARREARLLVAGALGWTPGEVGRRVDEPLPDVEADRLRVMAARRAKGEPLAYVTGSVGFRDLTLFVDARVLIPRPETEVVVEEALRAAAGRPGGVAVDIGTGSGAIALSLATEGTFDRVIATDLSTDALQVARENALRLRPKAPVDFRHGADLAPLDGLRARVIVSNPPYIAYDEASALPAAVRDWEPASALFAADGGMARYDALLAHGQHYLETDGTLVLEVDSRRGVETARRASEYGWVNVRLVRDLAGRDRVLVAQPASSATPQPASGPEARPHA